MKRDPNMPINVWPIVVSLAAIGAGFVGFFVAALSVPVSSCPTEALCFGNGSAGLIGALVAGVIASLFSMRASRVQSPIATLVTSTLVAVSIFRPVMSIPYQSGTPESIKFLVTACIFAAVLWLCNYLVRRLALVAHGGRK